MQGLLSLVLAEITVAVGLDYHHIGCVAIADAFRLFALRLFDELLLESIRLTEV